MLQNLKGQPAQLINCSHAGGPSLLRVQQHRWHTRLDAKGFQMSVVNDLRTLRGRAESPLRVGAAIIGQGAPVFQPAIEAGMNVSVHILEVRGELVPAEELSAHEREHRTLLGLVPGHTLQDKIQPQRLEGARVGQLGVCVVAS